MNPSSKHRIHPGTASGSTQLSEYRHTINPTSTLVSSSSPFPFSSDLYSMTVVPENSVSNGQPIPPYETAHTSAFQQQQQQQQQYDAFANQTNSIRANSTYPTTVNPLPSSEQRRKFESMNNFTSQINSDRPTNVSPPNQGYVGGHTTTGYGSVVDNNKSSTLSPRPARSRVPSRQQRRYEEKMRNSTPHPQQQNPLPSTERDRRLASFNEFSNQVDADRSTPGNIQKNVSNNQHNTLSPKSRTSRQQRRYESKMRNETPLQQAPNPPPFAEHYSNQVNAHRSGQGGIQRNASNGRSTSSSPKEGNRKSTSRQQRRYEEKMKANLTTQLQEGIQKNASNDRSSSSSPKEGNRKSTSRQRRYEEKVKANSTTPELLENGGSLTEQQRRLVSYNNYANQVEADRSRSVSPLVPINESYNHKTEQELGEIKFGSSHSNDNSSSSHQSRRRRRYEEKMRQSTPQPARDVLPGAEQRQRRNVSFDHFTREINADRSRSASPIDNPAEPEPDQDPSIEDQDSDIKKSRGNNSVGASRRVRAISEKNQEANSTYSRPSRFRQTDNNDSHSDENSYGDDDSVSDEELVPGAYRVSGPDAFSTDDVYDELDGEQPLPVTSLSSLHPRHISMAQEGGCVEDIDEEDLTRKDEDVVPDTGVPDAADKSDGTSDKLQAMICGLPKTKFFLLLVFLFVIVVVAVVVVLVLSPDTPPPVTVAPTRPITAEPTSSPTQAPTPTPKPFESWVALFQNVIPADKFYAISSPHWEALQWIRRNPGLAEIDFDAPPTQQTIERLVMAIFFYSVTILKEDLDLDLDYVSLTGDHVCEWNENVNCDEDLSVTVISFADMHVDGIIPTELALLTNLKTISFSRSGQIRGTIPTEVGKLTNLVELDLSINRLSGQIPTEIGSCTSLEIFHLYGIVNYPFNEFTGTIPTELGLCTSLKSINFDVNELEGTIPSEVGNLSLSRLRLNHNTLHGTLPTELAQLTDLVEIDVMNNQLTGEVPTELATLPSLTFLFLHENNFNGTIDEYLCDKDICFWNSLTADCEEVDCVCCTLCY